MSRTLLALAALALGAGLAACAAAPAEPPAAEQPTTAAEVAAPTTAPAVTVSTTSALSVNDVWARQSPMEAANGAVYMVITNPGSTDDALLGAAAEVSDAVEIHETKDVGGMMQMAPVESVPLPAGGQAELKPGGYHVMLIGLKAPLVAGEKFPLTLTFAQAGEVQVEAEVRAE